MSFWRTLKQEIAGTISAARTSISTDSVGGGESSRITSSLPWSHSTSSIPAWITVLTGSGVSGDYFEIDISSNSGSTRSATLIVWLTDSPSTYVSIAITQTGP